LLFRGYIQTRLVHVIGPLGGIVISSLMFAAFHMDWVHVIAVFPLGLFLGFIAWRGGSLLPAMLAHFFNNVVSVTAVVLSPADAQNTLSPQLGAFVLAVIAAGMVGSVFVAVAVWKYPPAESRPDGL